MKKKIQNYLVSSGEPNQQYGLYVIEKENPHHAKGGLLAYYYDSDSFSPLSDREKGLFVPALKLESC